MIQGVRFRRSKVSYRACSQQVTNPIHADLDRSLFAEETTLVEITSHEMETKAITQEDDTEGGDDLSISPSSTAQDDSVDCQLEVASGDATPLVVTLSDEHDLTYEEELIGQHTLLNSSLTISTSGEQSFDSPLSTSTPLPGPRIALPVATKQEDEQEPVLPSTPEIIHAPVPV
jgi:hypothetical protein